MKRYDVIIIGAGAIGSFALYHLAARGITNCLVLDRAHASGRGATGSWGTLLRTMHKSPLTTDKAAATLPFYWQFSDLVGAENNFNRCGSLYFLKDTQLPEIAPQLEALRAANIPFEIIDCVLGKKEFPHFNWFDNDVAIFEANAGTACPHQTTEALINFALMRGATSMFDQNVMAIVTEKARIVGVKTADGSTFLCDQLVVAAGIWSRSLLMSVGIELDTFVKTIQINRFCRTHFKANIPLFIDRNLRAFGHFFPDASFAGGIIFADDAKAHQTSAHRLDINDAMFAKMTISKRLNWLKNASLEGGLRATESYTRENQALISNDFPFSNLVVATGFSCTGFTLAPHAGETIAKLIVA